MLRLGIVSILDQLKPAVDLPILFDLKFNFYSIQIWIKLISDDIFQYINLQGNYEVFTLLNQVERKLSKSIKKLLVRMCERWSSIFIHTFNSTPSIDLPLFSSLSFPLRSLECSNAKELLAVWAAVCTRYALELRESQRSQHDTHSSREVVCLRCLNELLLAFVERMHSFKRVSFPRTHTLFLAVCSLVVHIVIRFWNRFHLIFNLDYFPSFG